MPDLFYTLVGDGPTDRRLLPIVDWSIRQVANRETVGQWADLGFIRPKPRDLSEKLATALRLYPCDLLIVHRDMEGQALDDRRREIDSAAGRVHGMPSHVRLVPARMQEAWLLIDEDAIRTAADNPNGHEELNLPEIARLEAVPDPKETLFEALRKASGRSRSRLKRFNEQAAADRLAGLIEDFSPLRRLTAFNTFETELRTVLQARGWARTP